MVNTLHTRKNAQNIPLSGARLNEICQLDVTDIDKQDDIWVMKLEANDKDKSTNPLPWLGEAFIHNADVWNKDLPHVVMEGQAMPPGK